MKINQLTVVLFLLSFSLSLWSANRSVVPLSEQMEHRAGELLLHAGEIVCVVDETIDRNKPIELLRGELRSRFGLVVEQKSRAGAKARIRFQNDPTLSVEAYRLTIDKREICIESSSASGAFYAVQTLLQWFPTREERGKGVMALPCVRIVDSPRFSYRGAHLDVARHFFSVEAVKTFIDMMAMHKLNHLHWHLTDDQGWRIEIKKYPRLTEVGAWRKETLVGRNGPGLDGRRHGGFYTQDQIREVVAYAADRNITIIPEIDLPGHTNAVLAAYPELGCRGKGYEVWTRWGVSEEVLCAGNDRSLEFVKEVLDELLMLFPSKYIHLGGDECPKDRWRECPRCQAKIVELGLKASEEYSPENRLQAYFMDELERYLTDRGRKFIGWDEILENGISKTATLMAWRSESYGYDAARRGNDAILAAAPYFYLNYYQTPEIEGEPLALIGSIPLEKVYSFEPIPFTLEPQFRKHILGVQACHWAEHLSDLKTLQYMTLPRLAAVAEVGWSRQSKDFVGFSRRVERLMSVYDEKGYSYGRHLFDINRKLSRSVGGSSQQLRLSTFGEGTIRYTLDGSEVLPSSSLYRMPISISASCTVRAKAFHSEKPSRELRIPFRFSALTLAPIRLLSEPHAEYTFAGASLLNDGVWASSMNFRSGEWMGFCGQDLVIEVELPEEQMLSTCWINCLISNPDWIFRPVRFAVYRVEEDGELTPLASVEPQTETEPIFATERYEVRFTPTKVNKLRIELLSNRSIPLWHPAKGSPAFLFSDEIGAE